MPYQLTASCMPINHHRVTPNSHSTFIFPVSLVTNRMEMKGNVSTFPSSINQKLQDQVEALKVRHSKPLPWMSKPKPRYLQPL